MEEKIFRHYLATLSFRATKAIQDAPAHYPTFNAGKGVFTPVELLSHISDVLTRGYSWFVEVETSNKVQDWEVEVERFYDIVEKLDQAFARHLPVKDKIEKLLQGPLADAMTHVGQLIMLRRLADAPSEKVSYINANIQIGEIRPKK